MSSKQNVIAEALRLSEAERLEVAEAVYQSLEVQPTRTPPKHGRRRSNAA